MRRRSVRIQWVAIRTLRRPVRVVRESYQGAPVVQLDQLELILPRGRKHFRALARCDLCGIDIIERSIVVRSPADLRGLYSRERVTAVRCGTCTTSDPSRDWTYVFKGASDRLPEDDASVYGDPHRADT